MLATVTNGRKMSLSCGPFRRRTVSRAAHRLRRGIQGNDRYLHKVRQPFNVNALAQVAHGGAGRHILPLAHQVARGPWPEIFLPETGLPGLEYLPSQANFILVNMKTDGQEVYNSLLRQGMIVRPMAAYKLPEWIRVRSGAAARTCSSSGC